MLAGLSGLYNRSVPLGFWANVVSTADIPTNNTVAANPQELGFISSASLCPPHGCPIPSQSDFARPAVESDYTRRDFLGFSIEGQPLVVSHAHDPGEDSPVRIDSEKPVLPPVFFRVREMIL
jgi:hypothetical protein